MKKAVNRRSFMKIAGSSLGIGVLYTALPMPATGEAGEMMRWFGKQNGEMATPFSFVQLSDAHVGFNGPPDPLGTKAFERAVEMINGIILSGKSGKTVTVPVDRAEYDALIARLQASSREKDKIVEQRVTDPHHV